MAEYVALDLYTIGCVMCVCCVTFLNVVIKDALILARDGEKICCNTWIQQTLYSSLLIGVYHHNS